MPKRWATGSVGRGLSRARFVESRTVGPPTTIGSCSAGSLCRRNDGTMCGIAGLVGGFIPGLMEAMNRAQDHRGPNGRGVYEDPQEESALGHVRLSILDLTTAASQPMHSRDGRYVLVFNGEVYNFAELRADLEKKGRTFHSTGDTEVLLQGLEERGADFVHQLNGMFAFALWDRRERELLLV